MDDKLADTRPIYCHDRLREAGKGNPQTECLACSRSVWKGAVCPHAASTAAHATSSCSSCDGEGLTLGDGGDPRPCPACQGDAVERTPTAAEQDGVDWVDETCPAPALAPARAPALAPARARVPAGGPMTLTLTTTRLTEIARTMWRMDKEFLDMAHDPYPRTNEAYNTLPPSVQRKWMFRAETALRVFLGQYPTG